MNTYTKIAIIWATIWLIIGIFTKNTRQRRLSIVNILLSFIWPVMILLTAAFNLFMVRADNKRITKKKRAENRKFSEEFRAREAERNEDITIDESEYTLKDIRPELDDEQKYEIKMGWAPPPEFHKYDSIYQAIIQMRDYYPYLGITHKSAAFDDLVLWADHDTRGNPIPRRTRTLSIADMLHKAYWAVRPNENYTTIVVNRYYRILKTEYEALQTQDETDVINRDVATPRR